MPSNEQEPIVDEAGFGTEAADWQQPEDVGSDAQTQEGQEEGLLGQDETSGQPEGEPDDSPAAAITYRGADGKERTDDVRYEDVVAMLEAKSRYEAAESRAADAEARALKAEKELEGYKADREFARFVATNEFLVPIVNAVIKGNKPEEIIESCRYHFDQFEQNMEQQPADDPNDLARKYQALADEQKQTRAEIENERKKREFEQITRHNDEVLVDALNALGLTFDSGRDSKFLAEAAQTLGYNQYIPLNAHQAKNVLRTAAELAAGKGFLPKETKKPSPQNPAQPPRQQQQPPRQVPGKSGSPGRGTPQSAPIANPQQERMRRISAR